MRPENATDGVTYDAFLCHNSRDKPFMDALAEAMRDDGLKPFLDIDSIPSAEAFFGHIDTAIKNSRSVVILLSHEGWGATHFAEAELALQAYREDQDLRLIPVLLGKTERRDRDRLGAGAVFETLNPVSQEGEHTLPNPHTLRRLLSLIRGEPLTFPSGRDDLSAHLILRFADLYSTTKDDSALWSGATLDRAREIAISTRLLEQFPRVAAYFEAAANKARRRSRRLAAAAAGAALLAGAAGFLVDQARRDAQDDARLQRMNSLLAEARNAAVGHGPRAGLLVSAAADLALPGERLPDSLEASVRLVGSTISGYGLGGYPQGVVDADVSAEHGLAALAVTNDCLVLWRLPEDGAAPAVAQKCLMRNVRRVRFAGAPQSLFVDIFNGKALRIAPEALRGAPDTALASAETVFAPVPFRATFAISPDGTRAVQAAKEDGDDILLRIHARDAAGGWQPMLDTPLRARFWSNAEFDASGTRLAIANHEGIYLFDLSGEKAKQIDWISSGALGMDWKPSRSSFFYQIWLDADGQRLAAGSNGQNGAWVWRLSASGALGPAQVIPVEERCFPSSVRFLEDGFVFSCDGARLYHFGADGIPQLDRVLIDRPVPTIETMPNAGIVVGGSHSDSALSVAALRRPGAVRADDPSPTHRLPGLEETNAASLEVRVSEDERWLLTSLVGTNGGARLWDLHDLRAGRLDAELPRIEMLGRGATSSIQAAESNGDWIFHDVVGELRQFSCGGRVTASMVARERGWETVARADRIAASRVGPSPLVASADGVVFAVFGEGVLRVMRASDGVLLAERTIEPPEESRREAWAISDDGETLGVVGRDRIARFWRTAEETAPQEIDLSSQLRDVWSLRFSPDSKRFVANSGSRLVLGTLKEDGTWHLGDPVPVNGRVNNVVFSRDSAVVAVATGAETVLLHRWSDGERRVLRGHDASVLSVAFDTDGETLYSGDADGVVRRWRLHETASGWRALFGNAKEWDDDLTIADGSSVLFEAPMPVHALARGSNCDALLAVGSRRAFEISVTPIDEMVATLRTAIGRTLSADERARYGLD